MSATFFFYAVLFICNIVVLTLFIVIYFIYLVL